MATGMVRDQNLEKQLGKQMGCMAGFLHLFDRHQILTGKRLYSTNKRLPTSPVSDSTSESVEIIASPLNPKESEKRTPIRSVPSPDLLTQSSVPELRSPLPEVATLAETPVRYPLPLQSVGFKEGTRSSWKFRETPRLSLDSRASVDSRGSLQPKVIRTDGAVLSANQYQKSGDGACDNGEKQHRSPSVIARLMGLEQLPDSYSCTEPMRTAELRRSASESRVPRELFHCRVIDGCNVQNQPSHSGLANNNITSHVFIDNSGVEDYKSSARTVDTAGYTVRKQEIANIIQRGSSLPPWKTSNQRKSFFDSSDFFPEPKQSVSIYGEVERRLKMRGIDQPSKDLETLKQILEALQLKGLLHSKKSTERFNDLSSPIVVMKPAKSMARPVRTLHDSPTSSFKRNASIRRNLEISGENSPPTTRSRERPKVEGTVRRSTRIQNSSSPVRGENNAKSTNVVAARKSLSVETRRKGNALIENRKVSPVQSPRVKFQTNKNVLDQAGSPVFKKSTGEAHSRKRVPASAEDESSSTSESSLSTSSQTDTERIKAEEMKGGKSLLGRCHKLLHNQAEITSTESQPSPVSVLDSSFYKDESSSLSPVMKRTIDFKDLSDQTFELEDEIWSSAVPSKTEEKWNDCDFLYISQIIRASHCLSDESDLFLLLENRQFLQGKDTSRASTLRRKLIFDTITEILYRNRQLPPWSNSRAGTPSLQQIWSEFLQIQKRVEGDDLFEVICGVLKKDLAGDAINGWAGCNLEIGEAVLDIERLIFKDLVGESIRDLGVLAGKSWLPRRRLF